MPGSVISVRRKNLAGVMEEAHELSLVEGRGIEGDIYFDDARRAKRQVLLLDKGTLDEFGYAPGILREQILVSFPGLQSLEPGTRLQVGSAEVEITFDCAPCLTMARHVNEDGPAFVNKMMGRRGMLARVTRSGVARAGDEVSAS